MTLQLIDSRDAADLGRRRFTQNEIDRFREKHPAAALVTISDPEPKPNVIPTGVTMLPRELIYAETLKAYYQDPDCECEVCARARDLGGTAGPSENMN